MTDGNVECIRDGGGTQVRVGKVVVDVVDGFANEVGFLFFFVCEFFGQDGHKNVDCGVQEGAGVRAFEGFKVCGQLFEEGNGEGAQAVVAADGSRGDVLYGGGWELDVFGGELHDEGSLRVRVVQRVWHARVVDGHVARLKDAFAVELAQDGAALNLEAEFVRVRVGVVD